MTSRPIIMTHIDHQKADTGAAPGGQCIPTANCAPPPPLASIL